MINHFENNNILEYSLYYYKAGQDNYMNLRYSDTLVIIVIGCDPSHSFSYAFVNNDTLDNV